MCPAVSTFLCVVDYWATINTNYSWSLYHTIFGLDRVIVEESSRARAHTNPFDALLLSALIQITPRSPTLKNLFDDKRSWFLFFIQLLAHLLPESNNCNFSIPSIHDTFGKSFPFIAAKFYTSPKLSNFTHLPPSKCLELLCLLQLQIVQLVKNHVPTWVSITKPFHFLQHVKNQTSKQLYLHCLYFLDILKSSNTTAFC